MAAVRTLKDVRVWSRRPETVADFVRWADGRWPLTVCESARQAVTNQKRVDTTRAAREFARSRLDAEQRKFAAGTSTNFLVFQAQRDLAQAANNELRAILDYQKSLIDLEAVQQVPLNGGGAATVAPAR